MLSLLLVNPHALGVIALATYIHVHVHEQKPHVYHSYDCSGALCLDSTRVIRSFATLRMTHTLLTVLMHVCVAVLHVHMVVRFKMISVSVHVPSFT